MKKRVFILFIAGLFNRIKSLQAIKDKNLLRIRQRTGIHFTFSRIRILKFNLIEIREVQVKTADVDVTINTLSIHFNLSYLFKPSLLKKKLSLKIDKLSIHYNTVKNKPATTGITLKSNIIRKLVNREKIAYRFAKRIIDKLPALLSYELYIQEVNALLPGYYLRIDIKSFHYLNNVFKGEITTRAKDDFCHFLISGELETQDGSLALNVSAGKPVDSNRPAPFLFDKITSSLKCHYSGKDKLVHVSINTIIENIHINERHICPEAVTLDTVGIDLNISLSYNLFRINNDSGGNINQIPFSLYFNHDDKEPDLARFILFADIEPVVFLDAFPFFKNHSIRQLQIDGNILLRAQLMFVIDNPFEIFFDIDIIENNLVFTDLRPFNLDYLNRFFNHSVYKNEVHIRDISTDPLVNKNFYGIEGLPKKFIDILIHSEDPNFYSHCGIDPFFIGLAIAVNLTTHKFSRGGSTITMQVARNLFLNHEKNVIRKIEEVIIALLIENEFGISKKRILEIYINIIEFGPGIYGIKEATSFYFNKSPDELTTKEFIILTYIIPRPVHFYEAVKIKSPQLINNLTNHVLSRTKSLINKGIISETELKQLCSEVIFKSIAIL